MSFCFDGRAGRDDVKPTLIQNSYAKRKTSLLLSHMCATSKVYSTFSQIIDLR